jgi:sigma-B regulation protein RsbU (phosphoserine phosphatase)
LGTGETAGERSAVELALCEYVIESGVRLVFGGTRLDLRAGGGCPLGPDGVAAWAGFPVRGPDGRVAGALCMADRMPRHWNARDVELLETLADIAAGKVALQVALRHGAERAALAQTLAGISASSRTSTSRCTQNPSRSDLVSVAAACSRA